MSRQAERNTLRSSVSDPIVNDDKLAIAQDARAKGRTAKNAARLVGWSRATLYRHPQGFATRAGTTVQAFLNGESVEESLPLGLGPRSTETALCPVQSGESAQGEVVKVRP
jgi:hypothetical protein